MLTAADNTVTPSMGPVEMEPLLKLVQRSFLVLNSRETSITSSSWLCYDTAPPYYEGIAIMGNYTLETDHDQGRWHSKDNLTLQEVNRSKALYRCCAKQHTALYNQTLASPTSQGYLIPPNDTWWTCSSGLTPCVHTKVLNDTKSFVSWCNWSPGCFITQTRDC